MDNTHRPDPDERDEDCANCGRETTDAGTTMIDPDTKELYRLCDACHLSLVLVPSDPEQYAAWKDSDEATLMRFEEQFFTERLSTITNQMRRGMLTVRECRDLLDKLCRGEYR